MKIRTKLTLRYLYLTAAIFTLVVIVVWRYSEKTRETEFFRGLTSEGVTKANLFLSGKADAQLMQSIYLNNRQFIDEVEVAIYDTDFNLLYHDALEIDIIKETPELIQRALAQNEVHFYEGHYQAIAMVYPYEGTTYIITAAAYDGYGTSTLVMLRTILIILWVIGLLILAILGYIMAREALRPVSEIVEEVGKISGTNLDTRLEVHTSGDEIEELSQTFNRMLDRLERSFEDQKMFVSNISHELRTPLAALIAELELTLMKERTQDDYRQAITNGLSDARKIERLSSGLLDLARAGYDPSRITIAPVRLDEVLLDARELLLKAHPEYEVELLFDQPLDEEEQITISGNDYLLRTAFVNLMENNCKFSEDHTCNIRIAYYDGISVIRFSDTGIGIPKEEIGQIFAPFYRGTGSNHTGGYGIGMALVKKIIDLHGGKIDVQSEVGEGTSFLCEFPHSCIH